MAVAFVAATTGALQSTTQVVLAHSPSGTNRLLLFALAAAPAVGDPDHDTPQYGGVPMQQVGTMQGAGVSILSLWRLVAPATGSHNVVVNFVAGSANYVATAVSYSGVSQGTPLGTPVPAGATGTAVAATVLNTAEGNMVQDAAVVNLVSSSATASAHGGQTELANASAGASGFRVRGLCSYDEAGGNVDMAWTLTASRQWAQIAVEILAASAGGRPEVRKGLNVGPKRGRWGL